ncbi:MAG: hypothetical protein A3B72_10630 [Omnitrophica bacterium RIFCSPHIGHO2_02_FULL_45_28]|nr:MAG: hypothetical protein A3B72_10630 [Omnitrophica bacterium RIFCSPHIGHO2_02_FULL_45_28]
MKKRRIRGALLFETFIALMILSIGIVSVLRIFGESLFVGRQNEERRELKTGIDKALFEWFAYPQGVSLSEEGYLMMPLETERKGSDLYFEIKGEKMIPIGQEPKDEQAENGAQTQPVSQFGITPNLNMNEYIKVKGNIMRGRHTPIYDMDTVILKIKKPENMQQQTNRGFS